MVIGMQLGVDGIVRTGRASVAAIFRADRHHQLAATGLRASDVEPLVEVQVRGWSLMLDTLADPEYLTLRIAEEAVAGAVLSSGPRRRIAWIGVCPERRRRGYGRTLLGGICERADAESTPLELQVHRTNLGAIALYDEAGFRASGPDETMDQFLVREPCGSPE